MPARPSLLTVHAHPDDESIGTGGIMARYSRAGVRVTCVICTGGEEGEIVVPEMDTPSTMPASPISGRASSNVRWRPWAPSIPGPWDIAIRG